MECGICFSPYSEVHKPLFLRCGHTYCSVCIAGMSSRNKADCPFCNRSFQGEELPVNYSLLGAEELKRPAEYLGCPRHAHKKAKFYCRACELVFCSDCFSLHKSHQPEPLSEYVSQDIQSRLPYVRKLTKSLDQYNSQITQLKTKADLNLSRVTAAVQAWYDTALEALNQQLANSLQEICSVQAQNQINFETANSSIEAKITSLRLQDRLLNEATLSEGAEQVEKWLAALKSEDSRKVMELEQTLLTFNYGGELDSATLSVGPEEQESWKKPLVRPA